MRKFLSSKAVVLAAIAALGALAREIYGIVESFAKAAGLALLLSLTVAQASGCGAVASTIATVIQAVTRATCVLDTIEQFTDMFFAQRSSPKSKAVVADALTRARAALVVVARGGEGVAAAEVAFQEAYAELLRVVAPYGVSARPGLGVTYSSGVDAHSPGLAFSGARLEVPDPASVLE